MSAKLTLGPLLFHWQAEDRRDFYYKIADETDIDTVYLGEVVCSKRTPFFQPYIEDIRKRLEDSGKKVIFSTLAEVAGNSDIKAVKEICSLKKNEIEVNDASALFMLKDKKFRIGQLFNLYNEEAIKFLYKKGATHFCLPVELPKNSIEIMAEIAANLNSNIEIQVFGRMPLALSARCYHARAYGRVKANCQFVCEEDKDAMALKTIDNNNFLTINGIQTLSYSYLNLINELDELENIGVGYFRLSPHSCNMMDVIDLFNKKIQQKISNKEAKEKLKEIVNIKEFSNGFYYSKAGLEEVAA